MKNINLIIERYSKNYKNNLENGQAYEYTNNNIMSPTLFCKLILGDDNIAMINSINKSYSNKI